MDNELRWETDEYAFSKKPRDWYWALFIITLSIAVTAVILNNILFAVLILLAGFALALFAARPPHRVVVALTLDGVSVGEKLYPWKILTHFNIDTDSHPPRLLLKQKDTLSLLVALHIETVTVDEVTTGMSSILPKDEELSEPWFQSLMEYIGF